MAMVFEWDGPTDPDGNEAHIARHGVTTSEAEQVVRNPWNNIVRSDSSTYPVVFGRTRTGKYLAVVFYATGSNPEVVRVITAYDAPRPRGRR